MRLLQACLAGAVVSTCYATPLNQIVLAHPSEDEARPATQPNKLHGRFLHITDLHPDPLYKLYSSTEEGVACHRGEGPAGTYGAETSDCDAPFALINATFHWISENLRDSVDFVVWTGDSARHDSDEENPRSATQVLSLNQYIANCFLATFGDRKGNPTIPIIPTFGNNDILPHNILVAGPNRWLKAYTSIWQKFIPEEQRHGFERGGWFYVEAIPNRLAVFSLNTLYFFEHNTAVDGCNLKSEPGFEHMEWLRIQLQFMRERGMKAILTGHVPPARTENKQLWDESCWQKYTLWLQQYRDVVVGGLYGHMNIDHFLLQDTKQIDLDSLASSWTGDNQRSAMDEEFDSQGASDYLRDLRKDWSKIPDPAVTRGLVMEETEDERIEAHAKTGKNKKSKKAKKEKALKKMGGPWAERYQLTLVSPSIVPNYFPTLRIMEYNVTGLNVEDTWASTRWSNEMPLTGADDGETAFDDVDDVGDSVVGDIDTEGRSKKKKKRPKKPKKPDLNIPKPPAKTAPPGPAYSPQSLTFIGYTQLFANITTINNDLDRETDNGDDLDDTKWRGGKHKHKRPKFETPHPKRFEFEIEYSTMNQTDAFKLPDLTVKSYLRLAHRIGRAKSADGTSSEASDAAHDETELSSDQELEAQAGKKHKKKGKKHKKKKKHHHKKDHNLAWMTFVKRAFVGTTTDEELQNM